MQGFQVGQQVAVVVMVGRLPRAALGVRKAVAVVAMRLVGAPGVRRRELQVRRFARQAHVTACEPISMKAVARLAASFDHGAMASGRISPTWQQLMKTNCGTRLSLPTCAAVSRVFGPSTRPVWAMPWPARWMAK